MISYKYHMFYIEIVKGVYMDIVLEIEKLKLFYYAYLPRGRRGGFCMWDVRSQLYVGYGVKFLNWVWFEIWYAYTNISLLIDLNPFG